MCCCCTQQYRRLHRETDQFDFERERSTWGYHRRVPTDTVRHLGRARDQGDLPFAHHHDPLIPTFDHLANAELKLQWLATLAAGVKNRAIFQLAHVMHPHRASLGGIVGGVPGGESEAASQNGVVAVQSAGTTERASWETTHDWLTRTTYPDLMVSTDTEDIPPAHAHSQHPASQRPRQGSGAKVPLEVKLGYPSLDPKTPSRRGQRSLDLFTGTRLDSTLGCAASPRRVCQSTRRPRRRGRVGWVVLPEVRKSLNSCWSPIFRRFRLVGFTKRTGEGPRGGGQRVGPQIWLND